MIERQSSRSVGRMTNASPSVAGPALPALPTICCPRSDERVTFIALRYWYAP